MKKRSKLLILVSIMLVCSLVVGLAACSGGKKIKAEDATQAIIDAMYKSFNELNVKEKFGFDYSVTIPTEDNNYAVDVKGILDAKTANNNKVMLAIREKGADNSANKELFALAADDEFLYLTAGDIKRRFTGLGLGAMVGGGGLPGGDAVVDTIDSFIPLVINMLFGGEKDKEGVGYATVKNVKAGKEYTVTGGLGELKLLIGGALEGLGIPGAEAIGDFLGGITTKMVAVVDKNGYLVSCNVVLSTDMGDITLNFTDAKIGNNVTPEFTTPSKTDSAYIQHAPLNFTLLGDFGLYDEVGGGVGKFTYEVRADIDVFGMLRGAMANGGFDATKLFSQDNSKLFISLEHLHEDADTCKYCATKLAPVNGSILTIAYDPASFETRDLYFSANVKNILGVNTLATLSESLSDPFISGIITGLIGENIGSHISLEALITYAMSADKSEPEIKVLDTPKIDFAQADKTLKTGKVTWGKVANALSYNVTINGEVQTIAASETLSVTVNDGDVVTVQAVGNERRFAPSDIASVQFEYYKKVTTPTLEFVDTVKDGVIVKRDIKISGSTSGGLNYEYRVDGGEIKSQSKSSKTISIDGLKVGNTVEVRLTSAVKEGTEGADDTKIRRDSDWAAITWEEEIVIPSLPPTGMIGGIDVAKAVLDGVYFVSRLWVDGYEAKFNVDALVDFVANFDDVAGIEISSVIESIMADASWFGIKVSDKSMYGDVSIAGMNMYEKFCLVRQSEIDKPDAEKKSYLDTTGNDWTPSLKNVYKTGKDGKVIITNGTISTHDAEGNAVALTEDEAKELLATGYVTYTYTDINGNVVEKIEDEEGLPGSPGNVIKTISIDWDKTGVAQDVKVVISVADGRCLSALLSALNEMFSIDVDIPGDVVVASITLKAPEAQA